MIPWRLVFTTDLVEDGCRSVPSRGFPGLSDIAFVFSFQASFVPVCREFVVSLS